MDARSLSGKTCTQVNIQSLLCTQIAEAGAPQGIMSRDAARREEIGAHIAKLELQIIHLKEELNAASPTAHLPPEILSRIFIILSQMFPHPTVQNHHYWSKPQRMVAWSTVTEVSRRWREVALGCPKLWSHIAFHKVEWAKLMLERSKQTPRHIE